MTGNPSSRKHWPRAAVSRRERLAPCFGRRLSDAVADGFVQNLSHPGGNIAGFSGTVDMPAKALELLKELAPRLVRTLLLFAEVDPASLRWLGCARQASRTPKMQQIERQATRRSVVGRRARVRPAHAGGSRQRIYLLARSEARFSCAEPGSIDDAPPADGQLPRSLGGAWRVTSIPPKLSALRFRSPSWCALIE